jgi:hypothetical protein
MMTLASVPLNTIIHIIFAVDGGDLTIDGNGAETIDGGANIVLTAVGLRHLKKTATGWVTV